MVSLVAVTAVVLVALLLLVALIRFSRGRKQKLQHEMELLIRRSHRIEGVLNCLSDRYLPLVTKTLLVEYLIESLSFITKHGGTPDVQGSVPQYLQLLEELREGQQATLKHKVLSEPQLAQVQQALQTLPLLLRGLVGTKAIDQATAKEQISQIRFSFFLAHHDLLVREAMLSLDCDKKARALEKLRQALVEMEKVSAFTQSEEVIKRLNSTIKRVEGELFGK